MLYVGCILVCLYSNWTSYCAYPLQAVLGDPECCLVRVLALTVLYAAESGDAEVVSTSAFRYCCGVYDAQVINPLLLDMCYCPGFLLPLFGIACWWYSAVQVPYPLWTWLLKKYVVAIDYTFWYIVVYYYVVVSSCLVVCFLVLVFLLFWFSSGSIV